MKKAGIALATLAVTGSVMAQVTLYGVVDVAVGAAAFGGAAAAATGTQMQTNAAINDGNSRWGFKVVEDLGGGLKFTGQFEQNINYEDGFAATTTSRSAFGQLSGGFGSFKYGRTLSPSSLGLAVWELTAAANYSVVANLFGFVGTANARNSSEFSYTTPSLSGLTATIGYVTEQDGIAQGYLGSKRDANVVYVGGPLSVGLSYWKNDKVALGASTDANIALGANYNFGPFSVAGSWQDTAGAAQGWTLGAAVPVGPWRFVVDVAQDTGFDKTDYLLYAGYGLSKRTTVYANYRRDGKSNKMGVLADGTVGNKFDIVSPKGAANVDADVFGIGVRHNF